MKPTKASVIVRRILFLCILFAILLHVFAVFERKTLDDAWNYTLKVGGFANEPKNSLDIIGFGSSHMYSTLNPVYLYKKTGLRAYSLATQQQPVEATYYYIKQAFKTQKPKVVILEAYMFIHDRTIQEGTVHDAVDPFPSNLDKLRMINEINAEGEKQNYYFNFLKYHIRWKELTKTDFDFSYKKETDPMHGLVFLTGVTENTCKSLSYDNIREKPIPDTKLEYLERIINLVKENDSQLMLLLSPFRFDDESMEYCKFLHTYSKEHGIEILDMNLCFDEIGFDNGKDFHDPGHLNVYGSEKASLYISKFITEKYGITPSQRNDDVELWQADIENYYNMKKSIETNNAS